jgi:PAS domain S-box-containing protein
MADLLAVYSPRHRARLLIVAFAGIIAVAALDFFTKPFISLGFLYLFPMMIVGGFLSRGQTTLVAVVCAVAQEAFSNLPANEEALVRLVLATTGFAGTGLFIGELLRNRQIVLKHLAELERQEQRRRDVEAELQVLVNTSPAAILTVDADGQIVLANEAARRLLGTDGLSGRQIDEFLPALDAVVHTHESRGLRATLQCRGRQENGQAFLAGVWFSTYSTLTGRRMAAILIDLSEELRNREDLRFEHLLRNTRILMSAATHEMRNICSAALVVHKNLSQLPELTDNADFHALSTLFGSLETVLALELQPATDAATSVDLASLFDEVRVLIDAVSREEGVTTSWDVPDRLPLVLGERFGLIQVFLNLARNSIKAMEGRPIRDLMVSAASGTAVVTIRFEDTGRGIDDPARLFRPFHPASRATGLGLYVSRAIVRSFGGDLLNEPRPTGACFAIVLPTAGD